MSRAYPVICEISRTNSCEFRSRTGELPLELIRAKAKGCDLSLRNNKGFTLPSNIDELGDDITELDLSKCSLQGPLMMVLHEMS